MLKNTCSSNVAQKCMLKDTCSNVAQMLHKNTCSNVAQMLHAQEYMLKCCSNVACSKIHAQMLHAQEYMLKCCMKRTAKCRALVNGKCMARTRLHKI